MQAVGLVDKGLGYVYCGGRTPNFLAPLKAAHSEVYDWREGTEKGKEIG